ncbi:MAG: HEAT repeat domain-containing protein [Planctomycetota bacterium]|jgi:hypothetical protein
MDENAAPETESDAVAEVSTDANPSGHDTLPEELPPVEPPSASFIMQLFLVPAIIVAAVIGIWLLFGRISSGEQDWRQMISEMRSPNEHRKWRGTTSLAQLLRSDIQQGDDGQNLASNRLIATELTQLLAELLSSPTRSEDQITEQDFVVRAISWLDVHDLTLPVLLSAIEPEQNELVRGNAVRAIAIIASRAHESGEPLDHPELIDGVIELSMASEPLLRQVSTFALGFLTGDDVEQRLRVLLEDTDSPTRVNAAIALVRKENVEGINVFLTTLESASQPVDPDTMDGETPQEKLLRARSEDDLNTIVVGNVLKALRESKPHLTDEQKQRVLELARSIASDHREAKIRLEAENTARTFSES